MPGEGQPAVDKEITIRYDRALVLIDSKQLLDIKDNHETTKNQIYNF